MPTLPDKISPTQKAKNTKSEKPKVATLPVQADDAQLPAPVTQIVEAQLPGKPVEKTKSRSRLRRTAVQREALNKFKGKAREYLLVGGSRSGKTFIIIYQQLLLAQQYAGSRHLIARYRFIHAKNSVWLDTLRKVIRLAFPDVKFTWRLF